MPCVRQCEWAVRRDASRMSEQVVHAYGASVVESANEANVIRSNATFHINKLRGEYERVLASRQEGEYANFLVSTRTLHEEPDPDSAALQL